MHKRVNLNEVSDAFQTLAARKPLAFDILTKAMKLIPDIDPDAGFGSMHPIALYIGEEFNPETEAALLAKANFPITLYVALRASSFNRYGKHGISSPDVVCAIDFNELPEFIYKHCPSFNKPLVEMLLAADMSGNIRL